MPGNKRNATEHAQEVHALRLDIKRMKAKLEAAEASAKAKRSSSSSKSSNSSSSQQHQQTAAAKPSAATERTGKNPATGLRSVAAHAAAKPIAATEHTGKKPAKKLRGVAAHAAAKPRADSKHTGKNQAKNLQDVALERADKSDANLIAVLFDFLAYVLGDQVRAGLIRCNGIDDPIDQCITLVEATLKTRMANETLSYRINHLIEHKRIWDVVTRNKEGHDKEHFFSDWCRKVASC